MKTLVPTTTTFSLWQKSCLKTKTCLESSKRRCNQSSSWSTRCWVRRSKRVLRIFISKLEKSLSIRFLYWMAYYDVLAPSRKLAPLLVSRVKVMAKLDIAENAPQDGRISCVSVVERSMRVSTMPSSHGERVVMRLLDKNATRLDLHTAGAWRQRTTRTSVNWFNVRTALSW